MLCQTLLNPTYQHRENFKSSHNNDVVVTYNPVKGSGVVILNRYVNKMAVILNDTTIFIRLGSVYEFYKPLCNARVMHPKSITWVL